MDDYYDGMTTEHFREVQKKAGKKRKPRQRSNKIPIDGYEFTGIEAARYRELKLEERAGLIQQLQPFPVFELQKSQPYWFPGKHLQRRVYKGDFLYYRIAEQRWIMEEIKAIRITQKGNRVPLVNEGFYFRWDVVRKLYPHIEFQIVMR